MSLAAPWALIGLVALPFVWWLHKKLRRPPDVELPTLMFLQMEAEARALPRGRLLDAELLLALTAAALLAFAAAGPSLARSAPRRAVRVVVSGGGASSREAYLRDVRATLGEVRTSLGAGGELQVTWLPGSPHEGFHRARPTDEALLGTAAAGEASARLVLSDGAAPPELAGVTWVSLGRSDVQNTGIVSVSVGSPEGVPELFVTLAHQGVGTVRGEVSVRSLGLGVRFSPAAVAFELAPNAYGAVRVPLGTLAGADFAVSLETGGEALWDDDLTHDDEIHLAHGPLAVGIDERLPDELATRIRHALAAALGDGGFVETESPSLHFVPRGWSGGGLRLELETVAEGAPATRAPPGVDALGSDPLVRDLSSAGVAWVYAAGAEQVVAGEQVLLGRTVGTTPWPVVVREGSRIRLAIDPLRGEPRPVDTPFWPLLIQNLAGATGDARVGGGYRAFGLLDARSSRFGVRRGPFDADTWARRVPTIPGHATTLRPLLILAALLCLALLWAAPRLRRLLGAARANPHARASAAPR